MAAVIDSPRVDPERYLCVASQEMMAKMNASMARTLRLAEMNR